MDMETIKTHHKGKQIRLRTVNGNFYALQNSLRYRFYNDK